MICLYNLKTIQFIMQYPATTIGLDETRREQAGLALQRASCNILIILPPQNNQQGLVSNFIKSDNVVRVRFS